MKSQKTNKKTWLSAAIGFAFLILFAQPQRAGAQQWTTNGNHISNTNSGSVGIGTTNPAAKLDILSTGTARVLAGDGCLNLGVYGGIGLGISSFSGCSNYTILGDGVHSYFNAPIGSLFFRVGNVSKMTVHTSGNIGIGLENPAYKLDVQGSSSRNTMALFGDGDVSGYAGIKIGALTTTSIANNRTSQFNLHMRKDSWYGGDGSGPSFIIETVSKVGGFAAPFLITPTNDVILNGGTGASGLSYGNVGIGTTSPGAKLDVQGSIANNRSWYYLAGAGDTNHAIGNIAGDGEQFRYWNFLDFYSPSGGGNVRLLSNGNVGIGTVSPGFKIDVQGGQVNASGGLCMAGDCKTAWSQVGGGAVASVFGRTGAVAAATNDYTWAQINKTTSSLADLTTRSASDLLSGTIPDARFPATLPSASGANLTALNASSLGSGTVATARLGSGTADVSTFLRGDNTWAVPSGGSQWATSGANINYAPAGNVGIGTDTPTYKLHVTGDGKFTGNLTVDGNIAAKYQDVAEWVPASERISPGTVVVLDSTKSNQVISSTQAYDTRVAGVISEKPGIALGESGANKVLVATTGRVRIKVDATRGPIHIGDLLVTSDTSGMAMKSEPVNLGGVQIHRPGTLIGKALEPLAKGQGEILVLLSLQ